MLVRAAAFPFEDYSRHSVQGKRYALPPKLPKKLIALLICMISAAKN